MLATSPMDPVCNPGDTTPAGAGQRTQVWVSPWPAGFRSVFDAAGGSRLSTSIFTDTNGVPKVTFKASRFL